jgi:DNA-directed RNA polymerase specialized sigma24 family protein
MHAEIRTAILELPPAHHRVIVMRDVEGRPPEEVSAALGLSPTDEQILLNQARGMVRLHLERYLERTST